MHVIFQTYSNYSIDILQLCADVSRSLPQGALSLATQRCSGHVRSLCVGLAAVVAALRHAEKRETDSFMWNK